MRRSTKDTKVVYIGWKLTDFFIQSNNSYSSVCRERRKNSFLWILHWKWKKCVINTHLAWEKGKANEIFCMSIACSLLSWVSTCRVNFFLFHSPRPLSTSTTSSDRSFELCWALSVCSSCFHGENISFLLDSLCPFLHEQIHYRTRLGNTSCNYTMMAKGNLLHFSWSWSWSVFYFHHQFI